MRQKENEFVVGCWVFRTSCVFQRNSIQYDIYFVYSLNMSTASVLNQLSFFIYTCVYMLLAV